MCNGQLMPISQNTGLFSLLGTMYGGDGKSNFVLPNVFWGQESGLSLYDEGQEGGAETVTLLQTETPIHSHQSSGASGNGPTSLSNNTWGDRSRAHAFADIR